jgi:biopolymer transport protein ExbB
MRPAKGLWLALLGLVPALALAGSWWNNDWNFRKEVGLDLSPTGADVPGAVEDVPVLLRLSIGNFSYFNDTKPDGSDFRVLAGDDKTPLRFHFERYDPQEQLAFLWVRVPKLAGGSKSDKLLVYYGNADAKAGADVAGTYDASQALVLHFGETAGLPQDATDYKNHVSASTAAPLAASFSGGGLKFSGKESATVPESGSLHFAPQQGLTLSAWVKIDAAQSHAVVVDFADSSHEFVLGIEGEQPVARYGGANPVTVTAAGGLASGAWHHLALTALAGQLTLYVDGLPAGSAAASFVEQGGSVTLGASARGGSFYTGELDEVGLAKVARSADYLKLLARGAGPDSTLLQYGSDAQRASSGQGSYFTTIAKNLTVDGWVVIVICLSMLFIALIIMVFKALFLGRVERANRRFLADYRRLAGDATALDQPETAVAGDAEDGLDSLTVEEGKYGGSSLYALYHVGIGEVAKRVGQGSGRKSAKVLSAQSVEAIRATIDATATRLQQQLSARMVLLTIAISGGPFLGLLGTVIGVMITFAAIAASGDVNVNAIAPGTAAALAATVAGLAVAIPSLFGYNWLNSRIKAINADDRVFVDEFVARMAEQYS